MAMKIKKRCCLKDDRGSAIVEAVIVLPIVILAVMSVVVIISYISGTVFTSVDVHRHLRSEEGREAGTRATYGIEKTGDISDEYHNGRKIKAANIVINQNGKFLLESELKKNKDARVYVIDEKKTTRYKDLLEKIVY